MVTKISDRVPSNGTKIASEQKNLSDFDRPSLAYEDDFKIEVVWKNVILLTWGHLACIYSILFETQTMATVIMQWIIGITEYLGTTVCAHRLYTHRSFKANNKLRGLLISMQTITGQNSLYVWVRDHRVHHKYTDTNADPHNACRGFFFSHMGWLMCKKHPDVKNFGGRIDMSDLKAERAVMFQDRYFVQLAFLTGFVIPIAISYYCFGESFIVAFNANACRHIIHLNLVVMINSVSHLWGNKPFDQSISATDSYFIGALGMGEGWHNYHHVFPWDYKTSELPTHWCNLSLAFVNFFAWLGWATDLKTVSKDMIDRRSARTGDGSRKSLDGVYDNNNGAENDSGLWGWDDKAMTESERKCATILYETQGKNE